MDQVKRITKGKDRAKRIHLRTYLTQPKAPSSRASVMSGGVARIAGRNGIRTNTASSTTVVALLTAPEDSALVLLLSSLMVASLL